MKTSEPSAKTGMCSVQALSPVNAITLPSGVSIRIDVGIVSGVWAAGYVVTRRLMTSCGS